MKRFSSPVILVAALLVFASAFQASAQYIDLPIIPDATFTVTDFGAVGDGRTLNTEAIQKTVDAASAEGGGTVVIPAGKYVTGPFRLASSINLHLAKDATLLISNDMANYPILTGRDSPMPVDMYADAITAYDVHDIEISGEGTIDGQGDVWWDAFDADRRMTHRPNMIRIVRCTRLLVRDVWLKDSPMFHLIPEDCTDVTIENIYISAPFDSPNTDGIDFSGWNYLITGCTIDTGDDHIVAKPSSPRKPGNKNITIHNCTLLHGRGICIGSTTTSGTEDMTVSYCTFDGADYGIHIKSGRDRGGLVQRIRYENITMKNVQLPIYIQSYYASERRPRDLRKDVARPITTTTPIYRDITIRNVTATDCPTAGRIQCLPEMPIVNLTLDNVHISSVRGMRIYHVQGMKCIDTSIAASAGNSVGAFDADISGLEYIQMLPVAPAADEAPAAPTASKASAAPEDTTEAGQPQP
jgi:polygalacturonase